MSFRHTFITDFIYAASDESRQKIPAVTAIMKQHCPVLISEPDVRGMGYYAGFIKTSDMSLPLDDLGLERMTSELRRVTPVPFRITVLQESGAAITVTVEAADAASSTV